MDSLHDTGDSAQMGSGCDSASVLSLIVKR